MTSNTHRQFAHTYRWGIILGLSLLSGWLLWPTGPSRHFSPPGVVECVSADGRRAGTRDGQIIDLTDGRVLMTLPARTALCAISPNGAWFARYFIDSATVVGMMGTMQLEVVEIDAPYSVRYIIVPDMPLDGSRDRLTLSNDGAYIVINRHPAFYDLAILSTDTNQLLARITTGRDQAMVVSMQFTADDRLLMLRFPHKVQALDTATWQVAATWEGAARGFTLSPGAPVFIACQPELVVYDVQQPTAAHKLPWCPFGGGGDGAQAISPDGRYLLVAENPSGAPFWTLFSGDKPRPEPPVRMALVQLSDGAVVQHFRGSRGYVSWPAFQPDGAELVTYGPGGDFHVWPVRPRPVWLQWLGWLLLTGALLPLVERGVARLRRQPDRIASSEC